MTIINWTFVMGHRVLMGKDVKLDNLIRSSLEPLYVLIDDRQCDINARSIADPKPIM